MVPANLAKNAQGNAKDVNQMLSVTPKKWLFGTWRESIHKGPQTGTTDF